MPEWYKIALRSHKKKLILKGSFFSCFDLSHFNSVSSQEWVHSHIKKTLHLDISLGKSTLKHKHWHHDKVNVSLVVFGVLFFTLNIVDVHVSQVLELKQKIYIFAINCCFQAQQ